MNNLIPCAPVVCVLGHVDHGKTTLLDTIRKTNIADKEVGKITQHIGAYQIEQNGKKITIIDTPGHAAFNKMRELGANITDIAILVVAADDGFMPQTDEALNLTKKFNVPVVVAINKIDAIGANVDRVKNQMCERNITSEDWGGDTLCAEISALNGEGIEKLLELVLLQAELLEIKANPELPVVGVVLESKLDARCGSSANVIVKKGTLKIGDFIVSDLISGKVRAMYDEYGKHLSIALPSTPVRIIGFNGPPQAGSLFYYSNNKKEASKEIEKNLIRLRSVQNLNKPKTTPNNLETCKVFRVIVKADVYGSIDAVLCMIRNINSKKVILEVIEHSIGIVSKKDVLLSSSVNATIVAFNTRLEKGVQDLAKRQGIQIIIHNIIHELINKLKEAINNSMDPEFHENKIGSAQVKKIFTTPNGNVAGCIITDGYVKRNSDTHVIRKGEVVAKGKIITLKRFKDDVNVVRSGYECGIKISGYNDYITGDVIETLEIIKTYPTV